MSKQSGSLRRYILTTIALAVPMVLIPLVLVFVMMRVAPGDLWPQVVPAGSRPKCRLGELIPFAARNKKVRKLRKELRFTPEA